MAEAVTIIPTLRQQAILARRRNGLLRQTRNEYFTKNQREPGIVGSFHVVDCGGGIFAVLTMTAAHTEHGNPEITISKEQYFGDFVIAKKAMEDARNQWMLENTEPGSKYDN